MIKKYYKKYCIAPTRSSRPEVFCKKGVLKNLTKFTRKHLSQSLFFNTVAGLSLFAATLLKKTLAQLFSSEFWEISKNTFFYRTPPVAASVQVTMGVQLFHDVGSYHIETSLLIWFLYRRLCVDLKLHMFQLYQIASYNLVLR